MKQFTPKRSPDAMPPIVPGYTQPRRQQQTSQQASTKLYPESVMVTVDKILDLLVDLGEDQAVRSSLGSLYEMGDRFYAALLDEINRDLPLHRGGPNDPAAQFSTIPSTGNSATGDL